MPQTILFLLCFFNEVFFIALYLLSFSSSPIQLTDPIAQALLRNPHSAAASEIARANKTDANWPFRIACISFPVMALKQCINMVQLVKASRWLAEGDVTARRNMGLPRRDRVKLIRMGAIAKIHFHILDLCGSYSTQQDCVVEVCSCRNFASKQNTLLIRMFTCRLLGGYSHFSEFILKAFPLEKHQ